MKSLAIILCCSFLYLCSFNVKQGSEKPITTTIELGEKLFFEKALSLDYTISCASCHRPEFAFADTVALSKGVGDSLGIRNTPSVMNMAFRPYFFYDGRSPSLEAQAIEPIENPIEMHLDYQLAVNRVQADTTYQNLFQNIYEAAPDSANILNALGEFMRSLESNGSAPSDLWLTDTDPNALTESQIRGRAIFEDKGKCLECHFTPDLTGDEFRNIGLYDGITWTDRGRFEITKDSTDLGKFKTPSIRNVALTAPYMHNGQFKTLEEVIDFYDNPYDFVANPINLDTLMIEPLNLSNIEKTDLVNYLHALTDRTFPFEMEKN